MRVIKKGLERVIDFLFPTHCLECGEGDKIICNRCFNRIKKNVKFENRILSIYSYKDELVNELLRQLKYHHSGDIAKMFGRILAEAIAKTDFKNIVLVPIPLNDGDKRMHNHAELLANSIKDNLRSQNIFALVKNIITKSAHKKQAHTTGKRERYSNIQGTISTIPREIESIPPGSTIVLVDDVTTTGATISEAKHIISKDMNIDPSQIQAIVIAH